MNRVKALILGTLVIGLLAAAWGAKKSVLELSKSVPLPTLHDGDFDHFAVDLTGHRLFAAAEENSKLLVFDLETNKLIHTITDLKAPHSMVYRNDLKKLFVVDGDLGSVKIYDGSSYKPLGDIKLRDGADSSVYDPATKYLYVVDGGDDGHLPNSYITVVDTTNQKQLNETKLDSNDVEAMALESSGPRLFVDIRGNNAIEVFDRNKLTKLATWPLPDDAKKPTALAFDQSGHRLFVGTRNPGKLVVLDSNTGKVVADLPSASMVDDIAYDASHKRIYFAGTDFLYVFQQSSPDHYTLEEQVQTGFRAKTAIFVPQLERYYLGVPHHAAKTAELRVYKVLP